MTIRIEEAEEQISEREDRIMGNNEAQQKRESRMIMRVDLENSVIPNIVTFLS